MIGVVLSLLIFHSTLNVFSVNGFILLMGLVTKNLISSSTSPSAPERPA